MQQRQDEQRYRACDMRSVDAFMIDDDAL